jgi:hypothetical protein
MATPCQLERFCIFRRLLACRALQRIQIGCSDIEPKLLGRGWRNLRPGRAQGGRQMFFVAAVLAILSGLFYAASLRRAVMRSARWVSRCANTAVRSATIHCLC